LELRDKRILAQIVSFAISNLGFRIGSIILKTGIVSPFLYCYGCPFAAFGCPIGVLQNFIINGQFPFFAIGSLGVYGIVFGRAFCGWACPFGTLHDMLSATNRIEKFKTRNYWYLKYTFLLLTFALAWYALDTVFCKLCPSGSLFAALPFSILHPEVKLGLPFNIHMFTLVATVVLALLISRFWCRYLCPMGAIAGTFNKVSIVNISLDEKRCKKCFLCLNSCGMGIDKLEEIGNSTDCILCGRCVEACPEKALSFTIKK